MGYVIYAVGYLCLYRLYVGKLFKNYDNKIRGFYFFRENPCSQCK